MAWACKRKQKEPQTAVGLALEMLSSKKPELRATAEQQLRELGSAAIPELATIMRAENERRRKARKNVAIGVGIYIGLIVIFAVIAYFEGYKGKFPYGLFNSLTWIGGALAVSQTQKNAGKALALLQDPKTVGFLAEALWLGDKEVQAQAKTALIRLLPLVRASDATDMTPEQRDCLYKALKDKDAQLVLAVLVALRQIGDGHALAHVQRLIDHPEVAGVRNELVKQTAMETLPYIQEFVARELAAGTLLRAVSAPGDESTLLRPAGAGIGTDSDLLLRPLDSEESKLTPNVLPLVSDYASKQAPEQLHARNGH